MTGKYFAENPIGTDFDPSELVEKLRLGFMRRGRFR